MIEGVIPSPWKLEINAYGEKEIIDFRIKFIEIAQGLDTAEIYYFCSQTYQSVTVWPETNKKCNFDKGLVAKGNVDTESYIPKSDGSHWEELNIKSKLKC